MNKHFPIFFREFPPQGTWGVCGAALRGISSVIQLVHWLLRFGRMKFSILGPCLFFLIPAFAQGATADPLKVIYSEDLLRDPHAKALQKKLDSLGASRYSNFPYVTQANGHTFVYFSQLKTGQHGGGSIPVIAIRKNNTDRWILETLFESNGVANPTLLKAIQDLGVTKTKPLILREFVVSGYPGVQLHKLGAPKGALSVWGPVQYVADESKYIRTAHNGRESWLVESNQLSAWAVRSKGNGNRCTPIAKQDGLSFSEAAVAKIQRDRWIALIREDSRRAQKTRDLYQAESFDKGCTWTPPIRIGDGTQPDVIRIDVNNSESRLVMCVGDRTPLGMTPDLGIQCRASSNIARIADTRPVHWGPSRMIFRTTVSADLGQPQSIQTEPGNIETYFYAERGLGTATDILSVRHRLSDFIFPKE